MSTLQRDNWTEEMYIRLIREFRARPILWDPLDPLYYKRTIQPAAWDDIAQVLNIDPEECKRKMKVIHWRFNRERAKLIKVMTTNESGDSLRKYTSNWFAFKEMAFMFDKDAERKRQSEGMKWDDDSDYVSINMASFKRKHQEAIKTETTEIIQDNINTLPPIKIVKTETTAHEVNASTSRSLSDSDEEIKSFTSFIGNKMKKYTDVTKSAVEQAICDIIFQADQNYYENKILPRIDNDTFQTLVFDTDHHKEIKKEGSDSDSD